jgi:3-methyl-2-oxobutanoate hydroxymethyltransferase
MYQTVARTPPEVGEVAVRGPLSTALIREYPMSALVKAPPTNGNGPVAGGDLRPVTVPDFLAARGRGQRLTMLTAYDYTMARLLDTAGVDSILVGDSLGMVVQGQPDSLGVTLDEMIYHTRLVMRGVKRALVVADLPFMTYQVSPQQALESAGRLLKEGGSHAVKLEGGARSAAAVQAITTADIPLMGHIGLTPQSVRRLGGFKVQRDPARLLEDALAIEAAGAFALVVECVPSDLAARITEAVKIPTIGIGAGPHCDGQILVSPDMLGMFDDLRPRFVKQFADLGAEVRQAVSAYCREVREGAFPAPEHGFR